MNEIEKQQNILYAMGVNANEGTSANFVSTEDAPKLFGAICKNSNWKCKDGKAIENDQAYLIDVKKQQSRC